MRALPGIIQFQVETRESFTVEDATVQTLRFFGPGGPIFGFTAVEDEPGDPVYIWYMEKGPWRESLDDSQ